MNSILSSLHLLLRRAAGSSFSTSGSFHSPSSFHFSPFALHRYRSYPYHSLKQYSSTFFLSAPRSARYSFRLSVVKRF